MQPPESVVKFPVGKGSTCPLNGRGPWLAFEKDGNNTFVVALVGRRRVDRVVRRVDFVDDAEEVGVGVEFVVELVFLLEELGSSKRMGRSSTPYRYFRSGVVEGCMGFVWWWWEEGIQWLQWGMLGNSMGRWEGMERGFVVG